MLKSEPTWIASTSAPSETPRRVPRRRPARSAVGSSVSFSRKPSVARSLRATGAVRQSRLTPSQTSLPSAYAATAAWECVQNGHCWRCETHPAKSSRSAVLQSDGPRIATSSASEKTGRRSPAGSRASSGRRSARCRAARGSGRGLRGSPARVPSRRRRASEACEALVEAVEPGSDRRGDGLLEDLVVRVARRPSAPARRRR